MRSSASTNPTNRNPFARRWGRAARIAAALCGVLGAVVLWSPRPTPGGASDPMLQPPPPDLPSRLSVTSACGSSNPFFAASCTPQVLAGSGSDYPAVVLFRDTPDDEPILMAAAGSQVGAVHGLAYDHRTHALYAAAFHKRGHPFGPGGPDAIYRIDMDTREAELFARIPAGPARHSPVGGATGDSIARDFAHKTSLGDLDIGEDGEGLFVVNLYDRHIYRLDTLSGAVLDRFPHGAHDEPWAETDARPFGLKVKDGTLYHAVIRTAERRQDPFILEARVYASAPDGSEMRLVAVAPLSGPRGEARLPPLVTWPEPIVTVSLDWLPWRDGYQNLVADKAVMSVYPQPVAVDLELDGAGNLLLGLRDRMADMSVGMQVIPAEGVIEKPALPAGDLVRFLPEGGGTWRFEVGEHFYDRSSTADQALFGALAVEPLTDRVVASALTGRVDAALGTTDATDEVVLWYEAGTGRPVGIENVCDPVYFSSGDLSPHPWPPWTPRPGPSPTARPTWTPVAVGAAHAAPAMHSEWLPMRSMGDIERLCALTPIPSSTPTPVRTALASPTASATPSPSRTPSPSPSPSPSATAQPFEAYLPLAENMTCRRRKVRTDAVLVLDLSTSMRRDSSPVRSKLAAALEAAGTFVAAMALDPADPDSDRVALVGFNDRAWIEHGLSSDHAALSGALGDLAGKTAEGTRLDLALLVGAEAFGASGPEPGRDRALLLLTDGLPNRVPTPESGGRQEDTVLRIVLDARDAGITLYTIGLGLPGDYSPALLVDIAGDEDRFLAVPDAEELEAIYRGLAGRLTACR